jgi:hypothetical protein
MNGEVRIKGNIFAYEMRWDKSQRRNGCLSDEHVRFVFDSENDGMLSSFVLLTFLHAK